MRAPDLTAEEGVADVQEWFRDGAAPDDALLWWQLSQQAEAVEALRGLCHGPSPLVQLRLWVFMELMTLPAARIGRDTLNQHFHALRDEALELALRRLREIGLVRWEAGTQEYEIPPLAQQVLAMLAPLTRRAGEDAELAGLLSQVTGAHQLGTLEPEQLRHLQAQLARLHDEFADAIASGSEARLRRARRRHERVFMLVERASQMLGAITAAAHDRASPLRIARDLGLATARLLAMKSQFDRALHQSDRQRVTLGSTGVTTSDVRRWLQSTTDFAALIDGALALPVSPAFVLAQELVDVAEAEFERDKSSAAREPLPEAMVALVGSLETMALPAEIDELLSRLQSFDAPHPVADALLGGRYAQAAYRTQLLPLLGDAESAELKGVTGELARCDRRVRWGSVLTECDDAQVRAVSEGWLVAVDEATHMPALPHIPPYTDTP